MSLSGLLDRPVAHRGLHDIGRGIVENTAGAFSAAIAGHYAIECDVQISANGEAMVFHDDTVGRLIDGTGRLDSFAAAELQRMPMRTGRDRMITLGEMCDLVAGKVAMIVEIKGQWNGERRLERRVADVLSGYTGLSAIMSFDPRATAWFRVHAPTILRGVVQESLYDHPDWKRLSPATKRALGLLLHLPMSRPHFLSWYLRDLNRPMPRFARSVLRIPLLTWTVRNDADRARAARYADQVTFEGFLA